MDSLTWWTFVIALATVVNAFVVYFMWKANMKLLSQDADSLKLNREIFEASHRPFIGVDSVSIINSTPTLLDLVLNMKNYGGIPARELSAHWEVRQNGIPINMMSVPGTNTVLFPTASHLFYAYFTDNGVISGIQRGTLSLEVFFNASYQGIDNKIYRTTYQTRYNSQTNGFIVTGGTWE